MNGGRAKCRRVFSRRPAAPCVTCVPQRCRPANKKRFGMARAPHQPIKQNGRTQTTRHSNAVVYMGPAAHTPLLLLKVTQRRFNVIVTVNLKCCHPLTVVSRGERGKASQTHRRASGAVPLILTAEPQCRSGALKRFTVQRLSVPGCVPSALRSEGFCGALERFHCDPYPQTPQPSFRTHRRPFKDEMRV